MEPHELLPFRPEGSPLPDGLADLLRAAAKLFAEEDPVRLSVECRGRRLALELGPAESAPLTPPREPVPVLPAPPAVYVFTECEQDILDLLASAGRRLTTDEVLTGLDRTGKVHGDSTVVHALANLCRRRGTLTNGTDSHGRGYGLTEPVPVPMPPLPPPDRQENRTPLEEAILRVLKEAGKPLKGHAVATRCGKEYSSHFRETLSRLRKQGFLDITEEGYALA
jgi:hypothetical protein